MAKYNINTPAETFLRDMRKDKTITCTSVITHCEQFNQSLSPNYTVMDIAKGKLESSWAVGCLSRFGKDLATEIRQVIISQIIGEMMAFQTYIAYKWLTDEEDKLLEEKFKGKLPTAEAELAKGIVTRAKWQ